MRERMVGWAMNAPTKSRPGIPAKRVVSRDGMLTGNNHFPTPTAMEDSFKKDGVLVTNDTVVDFKTRFWDPVTEIGL